MQLSEMTNEELLEGLEDCAMASQNLGIILNGDKVFARKQQIRSELLRRLDTGERRAPDGFAYRYPDNAIRFNHGQTVNGCDPIAQMPFWFEPPTLPAPPSEPSREPQWKVPLCASPGFDPMRDECDCGAHGPTGGNQPREGREG